MATIFLFDIDGTLLTAHGAGRQAMQAAFGEVTGHAEGLEAVRFAGMTDRSIVRAGLRAVGADDEDADRVIDAVVDAYLARLPALLRERPPTVLPGVNAVLDQLAGCADVAIGVGTGNVEAGARAKLRAAELDRHFGFGGFGSDHELRPQLLQAGASRGARRLGRPLIDCSVLVVGDTPRDVAAANAIGAECLAVATSYYDEQTLREAGASRVVTDLREAAALEWLVGRLG